MNILTTKSLCFIDGLCYKDLNIYSNKTTFITGESGTGKSSLLKLLSYNALPKSGSVYFNNTNIQKHLPFKYRRLVTLALQDSFLFPGTIEDNFKKYYSYLREELPSFQVILEFLNICALDMPLSKIVSEMSGGEKQRLYLSIVLSFKPSFLLLDEPTSALDTENSFKLLNNLTKFCQENSLGLIVVSHDLTLVNKFADEIIDLGGDGLVR